MKYLLNLQLAVYLLLPAVASASVQTSPNYIINGGTIVSGGSSATDPSGMNKSGIAIGQGVSSRLVVPEREPDGEGND